MSIYQKHAVGLFFFNRRDTVLQVAARILESNPPAVYLVADGPRASRIGEEEVCLEIRRAVESLAWKCPVYSIYSDVNLGCGKRISSGISAILEKEEAVIVLEDDILPHMDFFRFCDEMLSYYKNDESVFMISGLQFKERMGTNSGYSFDFNMGIWGWGTWRRAWRHYQLDIKEDVEDEELWSSFAPLRNENSLDKALEARRNLRSSLIHGNLDTWDYQWGVCQMKHRAYCISPNWNLVENIGFGPESTHTTGPASSHWAGEYKSYPFQFPIKHPAPGILSTAVAHLEKGDPKLAMTIAREGISKYPMESRLFLCLAASALSLGLTDESTAACASALQIDPDSALAKRILGLTKGREA